MTGAAHLSITPNPVAFGNVSVGQTATQTFDITNTGNITLTLTKAAPPVGAFNTTTPVSEGQQLSPGDVIHQTVTFTPTATGAQSAIYSITGDDGQGAIPVQLTGTGVTGTGTTNIAAGKADLGVVVERRIPGEQRRPTPTRTRTGRARTTCSRSGSRSTSVPPRASAR